MTRGHKQGNAGGVLTPRSCTSLADTEGWAQAWSAIQHRLHPCGARRADMLALMADSLPLLQSQAQTSSLAVGCQLREGVWEHFTPKSN